jgi:GNAT superfamily N-acetyltransferase
LTKAPRVELTCYLQDLFTVEAVRGRGIGRSLIEGVYAAARASGVKRVYWQTHESNAAGRLLYDKVAKHLGFVVYSREV